MYCQYIGFCALTPDEQAAWVQAIGTILAVLIAIAIPGIQSWRDPSRQREQRRAEAAVAAILILPDVRGWLSRVNAANATIENRLGRSPLPIAVYGMDGVTPSPQDREHFSSLVALGSVGGDLAANFLVAMDINDENEELKSAIGSRNDWEQDIVDRCESQIARVARLKLDLERAVKSLREIALKGST